MFTACLAAFALSPGVADFVTRNSVETRFVVTDAARQPIAGASLYANTSSATFVVSHELTTDATGSVLVRRPVTTTRVRVWVSADGYVGVFRGWEPEDGKTPPAEFRFALPKATSIGGRVVDAAGKPIAGATIEARCTVANGKLPDGVSVSTLLAYRTNLPNTDAAGRWSLRNVPAGGTQLALRVEHPDYVGDLLPGEVQSASGVKDIQLRFGTAVLKLGRGAKVTGAITDEFGKPVPDALIVFHDDPAMTPGSQEVRADAEGRYTLPTLRPGRHLVTVVAKGRRPERRELVLEAGDRVEDFRLYAGVPLRVKVVDEAGQPVPGATFWIDTWRGGKGLYNSDIDVLPSGIPNTAKADGVFTWAGAPEDAVNYSVLARGFQRQQLALTANGREQTLVLKRTPAVAGKVTDAKTGQPVPLFRVWPVIDFGGGNYAVDRQRITEVKTGAYRYELERSDCDYRLLIEAPGYRTALSRSGLLKDNVTAADFALDPAPPVSGYVFNPAGKPAAGAKVSLATSVQAARFPNDGRGLAVTTDAAGLFTLPAQSEHFTLLVGHAAGFARVDRGPDAATGDITVTPWASVGGVVWQDGKPVAGQRVAMFAFEDRRPVGSPRVEYTHQMLTREGGVFLFDRVPAGAYTVFPWITRGEHTALTGAEEVMIDVRPGDALRLDFGKGGATVRGAFKLTGDVPPGLTCEFGVNFLVRRTPDSPPGLDLSKGWDRTKNRGDPAARDLLRRHRIFAVKPTNAGFFRVGGVPAGDYWLVAEIFEPPVGTCLTTPVGHAACAVTVTAADAQNGGVVEVPPLAVPVQLGPQVGDRFPTLALTDPAGKPIDLAALKGKPVLLHAWAGWCANCPRDYAALRKLRVDVPAATLAVVGLNFDDDAATAGRLAAKSDFAWPQACVGTPSAQAVADRLAVSGVPLYLVLDANGVVAYRGYAFADAEKVARAAAK